MKKEKGLIVMQLHTISINFNELEKQGKTVIYKESETEINDTSWGFWGNKRTPNEDLFVYRKIVTFEEAERYELENELLN